MSTSSFATVGVACLDRLNLRASTLILPFSKALASDSMRRRDQPCSMAAGKRQPLACCLPAEFNSLRFGKPEHSENCTTKKAVSCLRLEAAQTSPNDNLTADSTSGRRPRVPCIHHVHRIEEFPSPTPRQLGARLLALLSVHGRSAARAIDRHAHACTCLQLELVEIISCDLVTKHSTRSRTQ